MLTVAQQLYEQMLVIRSQLGDEAAFRELLTVFGPSLHSFICRMMQPAERQAEDLAQEIWISIFKGLPRLEDVRKFRPWAYRIARDRIYREYRRRKLPVQPLDENQVQEIPGPDETRVSIESEQIHQGLNGLSPEHREVLMLCFFEEMSYDEIARVTGTSLGTVRSRIHYAKRALKQRLGKNTI